MRLAAGLVLGALAAACFAANYAGQHAALAGAEALTWRRPRASARALWANRLWLASWLASLAGWGLYVAALRFAPLSVVQALSASALAPLALVGRATTRARAGAAVALGGLVLVLATVAPAQGLRPPDGAVAVLVGAGGLGGALLLVAVPPARRGAVLGLCSGLFYGVGDVATKAAVDGSAVFVPVLLVAFGAGFVALQLAYQRSSLLASAGLSALVTNALPIAAGVALFRELPASAFGLGLGCAGFVAVVAGGVTLAAGDALAGAHA